MDTPKNHHEEKETINSAVSERINHELSIVNQTPTLSGKIWKIKSPKTHESLLNRVSKHRKLKLDEELTELHSPWLLKNIDKAVTRLEAAITNQERIMVFGDYDVDGVTGATIIYLSLKHLTNQVSIRLPHRERDGYGLNMKVIDECHQNDVKMIITVDCGISNVKEIAYAESLGINVIITDHHDIPLELPNAYAILNPQQKDCEYPEPKICGAVVGFKAMQALFEHVGRSANELDKYMDMAAMATIADCMPLRGENRLIVKRGLKQFEQCEHRGLKKLVDLRLEGKRITSEGIGFFVSPSINAAGRITEPTFALDMMIGNSEAAEKRAEELVAINEERRKIQKNHLSSFIEQADPEATIHIHWSDEWPGGINGLLAGELCKKFHRPAICLAKSEEHYTASCRSIPGINILEVLQKHEDLFIKYGGHAPAAGFSIKPEKLEEMKARLTQEVETLLQENPIIPTLHLETELNPEELTLESVQSIMQLEPFGMGNPKPQFLVSGFEVVETRPVGDGTHLSMTLKKGEQSYRCIAFGKAEHEEQLKAWKHIDIACRISENEFRGKTSLSIQVVDARPAGPTAPSYSAKASKDT